MKKITKTQVKNFLKNHFILQMASSSKKASPHVSVLLYSIDEQLNFYCATHSDSQKAKNIKENPNVSLVIWEHNQMLVQVNAKAKAITNPKEQKYALNKLGKAAASDENFWPPVLRISGDEYVMYKLIPTKILALQLTSSNIRETSTPFFKIK